MTCFIDVALNHKKADRKKLFYLTYALTIRSSLLRYDKVQVCNLQ